MSATRWVAGTVALAKGELPASDPQSEVIVVRCERLEPDVGLCITRHLSGNGWVVQHRRTGFKINPAGKGLDFGCSKKGARAALLAIKDLADWTLSRDELKRLEVGVRVDEKFAEIASMIEKKAVIA